MTPTLISARDRSIAETQINELLTKLGVSNAPGKTSIGSDLDEMQRLKNGSYPLHMYHAEYAPAVAINELQRNMLIEHGYNSKYSHRTYPRALFRRNLAERHACVNPVAHAIDGNMCMCNEFIESIRVEDPEQEMKVIAEERRQKQFNRLKTVIGSWTEDITKIEALPEESQEDPAVTIARLQGQLEGLTGEGADGAATVRRGPGRPPKNS